MMIYEEGKATLTWDGGRGGPSTLLGVNFINIITEIFVPIFLRQKLQS